MIELQNVSRTYKMGDDIIHALDSVNLKIEKGEFVAIVGPSGSGKSTLANIIGGLDEADNGTIVVDDQNISKISDKKLSYYRNKKIGFVFQSFNLQPNLTALENVMLPMLFSRVKYSERRERASQCLKLVGLEERMKHKPYQLSGGQRQRVSIARALANNPEIIIADEPTGNLDSVKSKEIIELLSNLNKQNGITLIIITHDQNIARQASKVISIMDGKLKELR